MVVVFLIYSILGYLAVPHTLWADKVMFGTPEALRNRRMVLGILLGWLIIPWWFLKKK